jgi:hypothetical protein
MKRLWQLADDYVDLKRKETMSLKYVEIIFDEADATTRDFVKKSVEGSALGAAFTLTRLHGVMGFTDPIAGVRYRVYPARKDYDNEELRKTCRAMDRTKGAALEAEN